MEREHRHDEPVTRTHRPRTVQRRPGQIHVRGNGSESLVLLVLVMGRSLGGLAMGGLGLVGLCLGR